MSPKTAAIAVLDIGKTNKKGFLFDERYRIVYEQSDRLAETKDQDGFPCEDVVALTQWVIDFQSRISGLDVDIKAINVSAYGASFVHIGHDGRVIDFLSSYLKPYPAELLSEFRNTYGSESGFCLATASPALGSLNSGMQLYRLKKERPDVFTRVQYSLHLPQFIVWLLTGRAHSDVTSIGCHTALWDFGQRKYHEWVGAEDIDRKLAPLFGSHAVFASVSPYWQGMSGVGLHDSSAALIPYLAQYPKDFILISTGTWSITLNPFNSTPLTNAELRQDCLCFLDYRGNPVKASRLHLGNEHDARVRKLTVQFDVPVAVFEKIHYDPAVHDKVKQQSQGSEADTYEEAYHAAMIELVEKQVASARLVMDNPPARIFVDGGFSHNFIFMKLLSEAFAGAEVYAASVAQASAVGAALAIHSHWNSKPIPDKLIALTRI